MTNSKVLEVVSVSRLRRETGFGQTWRPRLHCLCLSSPLLKQTTDINSSKIWSAKGSGLLNGNKQKHFLTSVAVDHTDNQSRHTGLASILPLTDRQIDLLELERELMLLSARREYLLYLFSILFAAFSQSSDLPVTNTPYVCVSVCVWGGGVTDWVRKPRVFISQRRSVLDCLFQLSEEIFFLFCLATLHVCARSSGLVKNECWTESKSCLRSSWLAQQKIQPRFPPRLTLKITFLMMTRCHG